ncbi:MAG TPA: hypothetical protein VHI93_03570 [Candidatus Thermoplasmatota archaeon]|nr:hypothetical protein [Candidatus Thermoplasmatota archaeon]
MGTLHGIAQAVAALALVLAAAKAHGRQLRLERTQAGHPHADFRGGNDPWVEALWRRDRILFWALFSALTPGLATVAALGHWPVASTTLGRAALGVAWAFAACFCLLGVGSLLRIAKRAVDGWRSVLGASFLRWALVGLLFGLSVSLARP